MRKLTTDDLFDFMALADIFDIKAVANKIYSSKKYNPENKEAMGREVVIQLFKQASTKQNRKRIYEWLSGPFEMDPEQIGALPIGDLIQGINTIASYDEWSGLFTSVQDTH